MELRDHPLMSYRSICNWPPVWTNGYGINFKTLTGELGLLRHAIRPDHMPNRCFLLIEHESEYYTGCLLFDDLAFCRQIHDLLQSHLGSSIKEIGSLNVT